MDALDILKVCVRRWYVILPCILLAIGAGLGIASSQKPTYTAIATYALVYKGQVTATNDPRNANPLSGDGAVLLGEALASDLMSGASQTALGSPTTSGVAPGKSDDGSSYSVTLPEWSQAYYVQAWGTDPQVLRQVVDKVLAATAPKAAAIQDRADAPPRSQYTTFVTSPTQVNQLPPTSTVKMLVAVIAVGLLVGAALSIVVDRLITRQRSNDDRETQAPVWDETGESDGEQTTEAVRGSPGAAGDRAGAESNHAESDSGSSNGKSREPASVSASSRESAH